MGGSGDDGGKYRPQLSQDGHGLLPQQNLSHLPPTSHLWHHLHHHSSSSNQNESSGAMTSHLKPATPTSHGGGTTLPTNAQTSSSSSLQNLDHSRPPLSHTLQHQQTVMDTAGGGVQLGLSTAHQTSLLLQQQQSDGSNTAAGGEVEDLYHL